MKKDLFTIGEIGKACDISRTSLRRLEEKGLVIPAYIDEKTGYRYYDNFNITKTLQIKVFQDMGFSYDDILEFYNTGGNSASLLHKLEQQLTWLKRTVSEIKLWNDDKNHLSCELVEVPDYVCYTREFTGKSIDDEYWDMYNLFTEAYKKGYRMIATEPLFAIHKGDDFFADSAKVREMHYICCIPLEPECASEETTVIPGGKALSILHYGDYATVRERTPIILMEKMKELGLKPVGDPRALGIIAPYKGKEITPDKFVIRYVLPVE